MSQESTLTRIPTNSNLLQSARYTFVIPDLPFARYFCQSVTLPDISTSAAQQPNQFSMIKRHGDTLQWSDLTMSIIVDEELRVYEETLEWLKSLTKPTMFSEYGKRKGIEYNKYYDGILTLNTNSNIPHLRIKFFNVHPLTMGSINFDTTISADTTITLDITFAYDYFQIDRL